MSNYKRFTKLTKTTDGQDAIACSFYGTDVCRSIHKQGCIDCPVFAAMLTQLYTFEEIMEEENGIHEHDTGIN